MITGISQHVNVEHEFLREQERVVTAIKDSAATSSVSLSSTSNKSENTRNNEPVYEQNLTPAESLQKKIIEMLSGSPIKLFDAIHQRISKLEEYNNNLFISASSFSNALLSVGIEINGQFVSESASLNIKERLYEYERLDFSTSITLNSEGSTREMSLSLSFTRELEIYSELQMSAVEFKDPLIVNLGNKSNLFADSSKQFDLDADGSKEEIPDLNSGVYYLALDRNNNGVIDNGSELFGARTGNGFGELSHFDSNQNGVIENQDEQFGHLKLWDGEHSLSNLSDSGITGISLSASNTPFTFTNGVGSPIARLRQTSVFITDKQTLGAIHQIDIAV